MASDGAAIKSGGGDLFPFMREIQCLSGQRLIEKKKARDEGGNQPMSFSIGSERPAG